tara:strand:- start:958 stop:2016 length:1059 start_codon:yes stop_codon:yes gene_type:complete
MMRFYTQRHQYTLGIDLHARTMYLCLLDSAGQIVLHRNVPTSPEALLEAVEPYRDDLVVAAECMFAWYWLADTCVDHGIAFVLGHALYMKAIYGGKAKNDRIDAEKIARLTFGMTLPIAYVYPPRMRATRDLMRRRTFLVRQRALLLTHIQTTCQQYNLPSFNRRIAYRANRDGLDEHFASVDVSVGDMVRMDMQLINELDTLIRHAELAIVNRAKVHDAAMFYRLRSIPGVGKVLGLIMMYEIHQISRFPRVQDFVSYCRLVRPAKESAGKRSGGSSGKKIGNAHLKWALSEATTLLMSKSPEAKKFVERKSKKYGKAKAISVLAAKLGRAVYHMLRDEKPFDEGTFFAGL